MGTEIERRFRVVLERLCPNGEDGKVLPKGRWVKQAYLVTHDPSIRVRVVGWDATPVTAERGEPRFSQSVMTIKGPGSIKRDEWNVPVTGGDALELIDIAKCGHVEKVRSEMLVGSSLSSALSGTRWELDRFLGAHEGLWLAEVELPAEDSPFNRPTWLGKEVTDDSRYNSAQLARNPDRFWEKESVFDEMP